MFTHPNVGTVGLTEAQARERFGAVRVFRTEFKPLKHTLSGSAERTLMKLVVDAASDRVVGLHMVGDDAGEIVQGFAVAMKAGATKAQFDATIGIHPTRGRGVRDAARAGGMMCARPHRRSCPCDPFSPSASAFSWSPPACRPSPPRRARSSSSASSGRARAAARC